MIDRDRPPHFLSLPDGRRIAFRSVPAGVQGADRSALVWLGGFRSDMRGGKACALEAYAESKGRACLRFDYSGHGESNGAFEDGTIGRWLEESLAIIEAETAGPLVLIGSSMGGWLTLLVARALASRGQADRLAGMVLVAPAPDFTQALMEPSLPPEATVALAREGRWAKPSAYSSEPTIITRALIEEGRAHLLLSGTVRSHCPVHILQGMQDPDVPWSHALTLVEHMAADPVVLTLIRDGDHRLSRDEDIARLIAAVDAIA